MSRLIYPISDPLMQDIALSGGKGAGLSRLSGLSGISVPDGAIVTTVAYRKLIQPVVLPLLEQYEANSGMAAVIRGAIQNISLPEDFVKALEENLQPF